MKYKVAINLIHLQPKIGWAIYDLQSSESR